MTKSTSFSGAQGSAWSDQANWSNGEPATGDTVSIYTYAPALTDLDIESETVTDESDYPLTFNGSLPGASTQMVIGLATTFTFAGGRDSYTSMVFNGSIINAGTLLVAGFAEMTINPDGNTPGLLTNTGTIEVEGTGEEDDGGVVTVSTSGTSVLENDGLLLLKQRNGSVLSTDLTLGATTGSGTVSVVGYAFAYLNQIEFAQGLQGSLALTITDGTIAFDANAAGFNSAASLSFMNNNGVAVFADVAVTTERMPIYGFQSGDSIALGNSSIDALDYDPASHILHLYNSANADLADLTIIPSGQQAYSSGDFSLAPVTGSVGHPALPGMVLTVDVACYRAGTRILTDRGEVPVEALKPGDMVATAAGATRPVRWVGHRDLDLARHSERSRAQPICVQAGSFGNGLPRRDLWVSPEHAFYVDEVLVPARCLVGCRGIAVDARPGFVTYCHVELSSHDVILAEGLPSESWLDTGNRAMFANAAVQPEDFSDRPIGEQFQRGGLCAPLVVQGPTLDALRRRLDAAPEQAATIEMPGQHRFVVAPGAGAVQLTSPTGRAAGDMRALGAAIRAISLDGQAIGLTDARLGRGFHQVEGDWRWTNGAASLALGASDKQRVLMVDVVALAS